MGLPAEIEFSGKRHNFTESFTHFCSGVPLEDIAVMMDIPLEKLESRARNERWTAMKARVEAQMHSLVPVHPDEMVRRSNLIQENREKNHALWCDLRDNVMTVVNKLKETGGKKMVTQLFHNKGQIIEHVRDISLQELNTLANYFQVVCQGTYAALGDRISSTGAKDDAMSNPGQSQVPTIQIILPGVISRPRSERGADDAKSVKGEVVDV